MSHVAFLCGGRCPLPATKFPKDGSSEPAKRLAVFLQCKKSFVAHLGRAGRVWARQISGVLPPRPGFRAPRVSCWGYFRRACDETARQLMTQQRHFANADYRTAKGSICGTARYGMSDGNRDHSGLMFANFTTLAHFSVSAAINLRNSPGELADDFAAQINKPLLKRGIGEAGVNLAVEGVDDHAGRIFRRPDPKPCGRLVTRQELEPRSGCQAAPPDASCSLPPARGACQPG